MEESLEKVIERLILPQYPLIKYFEVRPIGLGNSLIKIVFYIDVKKNTIGNLEAYKIMDETTSLFKMLGPEKGSELVVTFDKAE